MSNTERNPYLTTLAYSKKYNKYTKIHNVFKWTMERERQLGLVKGVGDKRYKQELEKLKGQ